VTDERLRDGEGRCVVSGTQADAARTLIAGLRSGHLTAPRLALAACLGNEAAIVAREGICSEIELPANPVNPFDAALALLDECEQRRFACDCAERVLRFWTAFAGRDTRPHDAITAARRYAAGQATDEELERARQGAEAAGWCTAIHAADAAEAAKAAATREPGFARWAAEVAVRVVARASAQSIERVPIVPFEDVDFAPFDAAHRTAATAEREWQDRRVAAYLLRLVE
jgi:hypothetical protein